MKKKAGLLILLFINMTTGCASLETAFYHEPHEITREDANRIHPHSRPKDTHQRLTLEESKLINKLYGEEINQEGDVIAYYNARWHKPFFPLTKGNIFLVHASGETNQLLGSSQKTEFLLTLLICTTGGRIDEVILKNNPVARGKRVMSDEFLRQFIGRSLGHSWEMAKDPSDLLSLPDKIQPLSGYTKTSEEVANAIRKVLVWASVLRIN